MTAFVKYFFVDNCTFFFLHSIQNKCDKNAECLFTLLFALLFSSFVVYNSLLVVPVNILIYFSSSVPFKCEPLSFENFCFTQPL